MINYNKRLVEVDEILKYFKEDDLAKIPDDIKRSIKENKDKEYTWKYDVEKPLKEQEVSRDTIAILSYLNMEYLLNEKQKEFMEVIYKRNEQKKIKQKYSSNNQYKYDDLFKKKTDKDRVQQETSLIKIKKESLFIRIINKIKNYFTK